MKVFAFAILSAQVLFASTLVGEWSLSVSAIAEYGHEISGSDREITEDRWALPPGIIVPGNFDATLLSRSSVSSSSATGLESVIGYSHQLGTRFSVFVGGSFEVLWQDMTFEIEQWVVYRGFNPITRRIGGPPILIGSATTEVNSLHLIPQLHAEASWHVSERLTLSGLVQGGWGYASYDHFEFYNDYHELIRVIPPERQTALLSTSDDWIPRVSLGIGLNYRISESWSFIASQLIVWSGDYELENTAVNNNDFHLHSVEIADQTASRSSVGFRYRF